MLYGIAAHFLNVSDCKWWKHIHIFVFQGFLEPAPSACTPLTALIYEKKLKLPVNIRKIRKKAPLTIIWLSSCVLQFSCIRRVKGENIFIRHINLMLEVGKKTWHEWKMHEVLLRQVLTKMNNPLASNVVPKLTEFCCERPNLFLYRWIEVKLIYLHICSVWDLEMCLIKPIKLVSLHETVILFLSCPFFKFQLSCGWKPLLFLQVLAQPACCLATIKCNELDMMQLSQVCNECLQRTCFFLATHWICKLTLDRASMAIVPLPLPNGLILKYGWPTTVGYLVPSWGGQTPDQHQRTEALLPGDGWRHARPDRMGEEAVLVSHVLTKIWWGTDDWAAGCKRRSAEDWVIAWVWTFFLEHRYR